MAVTLTPTVVAAPTAILTLQSTTQWIQRLRCRLWLVLAIATTTVTAMNTLTMLQLTKKRRET